MKRCYIIYLLFIVLLLSCSKDDNEKFEIAEKVIIIYMVADNNLYRNAESDIREMLECEIPKNCNLVVYVDDPLWVDIKTPQLFNNFKAQTYDLILWSHGTGWLQKKERVMAT